VAALTNPIQKRRNLQPQHLLLNHHLLWSAEASERKGKLLGPWAASSTSSTQKTASRHVSHISIHSSITNNLPKHNLKTTKAPT
jgi:hypothetical protein